MASLNSRERELPADNVVAGRTQGWAVIPMTVVLIGGVVTVFFAAAVVVRLEWERWRWNMTDSDLSNLPERFFR